MALCVRVLSLLLLGIIAGRLVVAQAPPPAVDCTSVLASMTDCLPYVAGSVKTPPAACCTELSSVVKNNPTCLCQLFNTTFSDSLGINITQAEQLPVLCKVKTPSPTLCASVGIPVAGPGSSTSPGMAPSPASNTPASPPKASSPPGTPKSASPPTTVPSGPLATKPPSATQPNVSTVAPSSPNNAHGFDAWNVGAAVSLLLIASMFL